MLEWSIVVVQSTSFEKLYHATFGNSEPFWVKGSTLLGTEFHETATLPDMQFILGHLNGNAICKCMLEQRAGLPNRKLQYYCCSCRIVVILAAGCWS